MNDWKMHGTAWDATMNKTQDSAVVSSRRLPRKKHVRPRLHQLTYDIRTICLRNPQGTHRTQTDRQRTLLFCAQQLFENNVRRKRVINLSVNDIDLLVNGWHADKLTAATICNRLVYLR